MLIELGQMYRPLRSSVSAMMVGGGGGGLSFGGKECLIIICLLVFVDCGGATALQDLEARRVFPKPKTNIFAIKGTRTTNANHN